MKQKHSAREANAKEEMTLLKRRDGKQEECAVLVCNEKGEDEGKGEGENAAPPRALTQTMR
jgi:hypothetical protein